MEKLHSSSSLYTVWPSLVYSQFWQKFCKAKMRAQTLLVAAVASLAFLGVAQAIRCYSCVYAIDYDGAIDGAPPQDAKCGDPFDDSMVSSVGPDTYPVKLPFAFAHELMGTNNFTAVQKQQLLELTSLFERTKSSASKGPPPYKMYCAKASGPIQNIGHVVLRGFIAGDSDSIITNDCQDTNGGTGCTCDENECNSASGLELSFGLIAAVVLISKFVC